MGKTTNAKSPRLLQAFLVLFGMIMMGGLIYHNSLPFIHQNPFSSQTSTSSVSASISTSSSSTIRKVQQVPPPPPPPQLVKSPLHLQATVTSSVKGNLGDASVVIGESNNDWLKDRWQAAVGMSGDPIPGIHWLQLKLKEPAHNLTDISIDFESAYSDIFTIEIFCQNQLTWKTIHQQTNGKNSVIESPFVPDVPEFSVEVPDPAESVDLPPLYNEQRPKMYLGQERDPRRNRIRGKRGPARIPRRSLAASPSASVENKVRIEGSDKHVVYKIEMNSMSDQCLFDDENEGTSTRKDITQVKVTFQQPATRWGISVWKIHLWGYK